LLVFKKSILNALAQGKPNDIELNAYVDGGIVC